jgi:hypothetical protein
MYQDDTVIDMVLVEAAKSDAFRAADMAFRHSQ